MSSTLTVAALADLHGDVQALPVTFAQLRFWLLDQLGDEGGSYSIPMALRLQGTLDLPALERSLALIVERHEVLRTVFALDHDEPVQVPLSDRAFVLAIDDLRLLPVDEREQVVSDRARKNANATFDLSRDSLFRASLLKLSDDEHVLLLALHHIVGDGWSVGVLYSELERAYTAFAKGSEPQLADLPLQYADFAVWQRKAMQGGAAARQLAYWTEQLRNLPTLELPTDRLRPVIQTMNGGKRERIFDSVTVDAMRTLARAQSATPYMAFLSAFAVLLHRYTAQTDLVIGSITSGRSRPEVESLIGLFVNTLAIRVDVDGNPTFTELLRRVAHTATNAYANQDVPFEQVVDAVQPARDRSRSPIFQVAFQLLEGLGRDLQLPGINVSRVRGVKDTTKFDLTLMLHRAPNGALRAVMEYNSDLFDAETVDRMLTHYGVLLAGIVSNADRALSALPIMDEAEQRGLLLASRGPQSQRNTACVYELVQNQVDANPQAVAVAASDGALTYAELDARANQLAAYLRTLGVGPGRPVGICLPRNRDLIVSLLAVLKTGGHYVPLDPEYPADRLAYILQDSGATVVIVSGATENRLPLSQARAVVLDAEESAITKQSSARVPVTMSTEQLAYVLHTSGSTGKPKGVMIPHRALSNLLYSMAERPGLSAADAIVAVTTLSFDIAGLEIWLPLIVGARVVVAPRSVVIDGHALTRLVNDTAEAVRAQSGRVLLQATPATWRLLLDAGWQGTPGLRMLCGGEAWSADLASALLSRGESLWNVYGPTETTIWSSVAHVAAPDSITLGTPVLNTTLMVLDTHGSLVPPAAAGELFIGGDGVALGYLNRPELTAEKFVPDTFAGVRNARMYRTGDLVRRRNDGSLEYLSRIDQQVKLRGFRIELGEIESALVALPSIAQAVVVVRPQGADARLVAYIIAADAGAPPESETLRDSLRRTLPEYMVPLHYMLVQAFPLTPNGKIDRRALPEPSDADAPARRAPVAPRTPLEADIAAVWSAVLGVDSVGVEDDFFSLGGHSLLAMRVVARLANLLPVTLTIGALFESRTVAGLAQFVVRQLASAESAAPDNDLDAMLAELEALSDENAAQLLASDGDRS